MEGEWWEIGWGGGGVGLAVAKTNLKTLFRVLMYIEYCIAQDFQGLNLMDFMVIEHQKNLCLKISQLSMQLYAMHGG